MSSFLSVALESRSYAFNGGEIDTLLCLFVHGPTWDGNVPSKQSRDDLVQMGLVFRREGFASLTELGLEVCVKADVKHFRDRRWYNKQQGS